MDVKTFLLENHSINRSELARRMWPRNKNPQAYLSHKLNGGRVFTQRDATLALGVLRQMAQEIFNLSDERDYPILIPGPKGAHK